MTPSLAWGLCAALLLGGQTPSSPSSPPPAEPAAAPGPAAAAPAPLPPSPARSVGNVKGPDLVLPTVVGGAVGVVLGVTAIVAGCLAWSCWLPVMGAVWARHVDWDNGVLELDEDADDRWDMAAAYAWKWGTNSLVAGVFAWALGSVGATVGLAALLLGFTLPRE